MRLSEAMKKGMEMSRPYTVVPVFVDEKGTVYACALGAVWLGAGGDSHAPDEVVYENLPKLFPVLTMIVDRNNTPLMTHIWRRNDAGYSREEILEDLERQGL